jgi:two-component system NtrC family sensor kinase
MPGSVKAAAGNYQNAFFFQGIRKFDIIRNRGKRAGFRQARRNDPGAIHPGPARNRWAPHQLRGDGLLGKTVLRREARIVNNFSRLEEPYVDCIVEEGIQSTVYVPLLLKGAPVGVMCACSHEQFAFSEDHVDFLTAIGNQIGLAVHNAMLYERANRTYQELKDVQEQVIWSEKLASLGKLSATIAHEINNPIAAVLTYVKLMIKLVNRGQFSQDRVEDISRYLNTMASEMTRCGEIVKNLLERCY